MVCQGPLITQSSNHPEYAQRPVHVDSPGALSSGGCCLYECGHCKDELGLPLYLCVSVWELDCEESWHWRIDAFELWCWRRLLRVPWTARRSNQSILKEISPRCSLEGMMLKLRLQYFGHLMRRVDSLEKTLMLGGIGGRRKRRQQRMKWLDDITDSMDVNLSELREMVMDREARCAAIHGVTKSRTRLSDWTKNYSLHLFRWSYVFAFQFVNGVSHCLICICWRVLASLG